LHRKLSLIPFNRSFYYDHNALADSVRFRSHHPTQLPPQHSAEAARQFSEIGINAKFMHEFGHGSLSASNLNLSFRTMDNEFIFE
jgi:hypothetical protein